MRSWVLLLGGLLIWTGHFFGIYILGSLFPGTDLARWLVMVLTFVAIGTALILFASVRRQASHRRGDDLRRWMEDLAAGGYLVAVVAMAYQAVTVLPL